MQTKIFIELFRFDAKTDYLPYYKKYNLKYKESERVVDLLTKINETDNFDFDDSIDCNLKVNGYYLSSHELIKDVVEKTGNEIIIEPISTQRAIKDLVIDKDDFLEKIHLFDDYLTKEQKVEYFEKYQLEYYASNTLNFNKEYIGDHALLIAADIIDAKPELKESVLKIISNKNNGIWYHTSLKNRLFKYDSNEEKRIQKLFDMLPQIKEPIFIQEDIKITEPANIAQEFAGFNIASYEGTNSQPLASIIEKSKAAHVNIPAKNEDLALASKFADKQFTYKIAGEILLQAKDNNADFLIVSDEKLIELFDGSQKIIEKSVGREINMPIISQKQFSLLLEGEKSSSKLGFDTHKTKIPFL